MENCWQLLESWPALWRCLLFVGEEESGWKGAEVQLLRKGSLKSQWSTAGKTNNPFHLASFSHLAHILSLLFFPLSVCPLPPPFTRFAHSFFLLLCGKFNGFLSSEWDILSQWTIITRVRATWCNSHTPSPTGYGWVFCPCVCAYVHVWHTRESARSVKTRYCRLVKPSGWLPRLLSSQSAYSALKNNRHGQVLTHMHTSAKKWKITPARHRTFTPCSVRNEKHINLSNQS